MGASHSATSAPAHSLSAPGRAEGAGHTTRRRAKRRARDGRAGGGRAIAWAAVSPRGAGLRAAHAEQGLVYCASAVPPPPLPAAGHSSSRRSPVRSSCKCGCPAVHAGTLRLAPSAAISTPGLTCDARALQDSLPYVILKRSSLICNVSKIRLNIHIFSYGTIL